MNILEKTLYVWTLYDIVTMTNYDVFIDRMRKRRQFLIKQVAKMGIVCRRLR